MLCILDGDVMDAADAQVSILDEGLLRGDGVFEVVRLYGGRPFAMEDHLARMERSAGNLRLPFAIDAVRSDLAALLEAGRPGDGVLRVLVTRGGRRIAFIEPLPALPATLALRTITYSPTRILDGVKSLSYAGNMLAGRLAVERGADEALLVTPHGRVLEGPTNSFFCSFDGESLVTPPLEDHVLDSITRRRLLTVAPAREAAIALDDLARAGEAFMASTLLEVHPVRSIDGAALPAAPGPLTQAAAGALRAHIEDALAASAAR